MTEEEKAAKALEKENKAKGLVTVPEQVLIDIQDRMAKQDIEMEELRAKNAGIEEMLDKGASPEGGENKGLRKKNNFEPKFRTVRLRKYPMKGDYENKGYVVGWTNRGAYQQVDDTGVTKQWVDFIEVIFLGHEKDAKTGKLQAEKIKLLDLMNYGEQVNCKILDKESKHIEVPTGEEITVNTFDPQHGLVATGEVVDGFTSYSEIKYKLQIPGILEPVWVDSLYCNS